MLESTITIERLAAPTGTGDAYSTPITRRAHVEATDRLVIDDRADSATRGEEIAAAFMVITQLADHAPAGSRITINGKSRQVIRTATYTNRHAPETAEHWTE